MDPFFDRSLREVAADLVGKYLRISEVTCTILQVLSRTAKDNAQWLKSKPLFKGNRPDPVDVYVSSFRGHHLLFLRTGEADTCVRIESVHMNGRVVSGPGKVGSALGLSKEATGDAAYDPTTTTITVTWHES